MTHNYFRVRKRWTKIRMTLIFVLSYRMDLAMATATAVTGTALAAAGGYDPWVWVVGGLGAAIVYTKKEVTTRLDAITNGVISVVLAGLVSPGVTHYLITKFSVDLQSPYPVAFVLSASWPWIVPTLRSVFRAGEK